MPLFLHRHNGGVLTAFCSILNGTPSRRFRFSYYSHDRYAAGRLLRLGLLILLETMWFLRLLSRSLPQFSS